MVGHVVEVVDRHAVAQELAVDPVLVGVVVGRGDLLGVVLVDAAENVLDADEFHVQAALGLAPKDLDRAGEDDDQPVAGVDRPWRRRR